jgi:KDO2-lipid IV(A) lauroyltransferase
MLPEILGDDGIAVYRPIKNPHVDQMMRGHRLKSRMDIVPMRQIVKLLASRETGTRFVLLIADQSPDPETAYWGDFFGVKTPFFRGPAGLAHRYDLPVFFVRLERMKRHRYRMHLEPLCLNPGERDADEILQLYISTLEDHIRAAPAYWLWTHRRWKHRRPAEIRTE